MRRVCFSSFIIFAFVILLLKTSLISESADNNVVDFLDGQTIAAYNFHGTAPDQTVVIGPEFSQVGDGVELTGFGWGGFVNINFFDTKIQITAAIDQPFGFSEVLRFVDANGTIPAFIQATMNPATNWSDFNASRISVTENSIEVNLTSLNALQGQQIILDLNFTGPLKTIAVTSPQGGEVWQIKTRQRITWTSSNLSGNVKIELSRDGGASYELLFSSTPNDGKQKWRPKKPTTTQALIKISSVTMPGVSDLSDNPFTLSRR